MNAPGGLVRLVAVMLCVAFVYSGFSKLLNFNAAMAEAAHFGLQPAALFAIATIVTQLGGSALLIAARGYWQSLGGLVLAGFTAAATWIGHAFWTMNGMARFENRNSFFEHIGLIGGFLLVAWMAWPRRRPT